jgi:hypothetical protein
MPLVKRRSYYRGEQHSENVFYLDPAGRQLTVQPSSYMIALTDVSLCVTSVANVSHYLSLYIAQRYLHSDASDV